MTRGKMEIGGAISGPRLGTQCLQDLIQKSYMVPCGSDKPELGHWLAV